MPAMVAIRQVCGTGYSVGPGELFQCPDDEVAESLASRGLAYYHLPPPAPVNTYETKVVTAQPPESGKIRVKERRE